MFVATDSAQGGQTGSIIEAAIDDIQILSLGNVAASVNDLHSLESSVYPNPAQNTITIQAVEKGKIYYTLTNTMGEIVLKENNTLDANNKLNVNISALSNGIYFLKIEMNGKQSVHKLSISK